MRWDHLRMECRSQQLPEWTSMWQTCTARISPYAAWHLNWDVVFPSGHLFSLCTSRGLGHQRKGPYQALLRIHPDITLTTCLMAPYSPLVTDAVSLHLWRFNEGNIFIVVGWACFPEVSRTSEDNKIRENLWQGKEDALKFGYPRLKSRVSMTSSQSILHCPRCSLVSKIVFPRQNWQLTWLSTVGPGGDTWRNHYWAHIPLTSPVWDVESNEWMDNREENDSSGTKIDGIPK